MKTIIKVAAANFMLALPLPVAAASLQVAPVSLDILTPGASAVVNLRNTGKAPLTAQLRVFRWTQSNGEEKLEPTDEVVASPPAATLDPGPEYAVRIVRLNSRPVSGEAEYRLVVDELPDPNRARNGAVALVVRYSIPVFFSAPDAPPPHLVWSLEKRSGRLSLVVRNDGARRLRLSALSLVDGAGRRIGFGRGLAGYVLGRSTMRFTPNEKSSGFGSGTISVSAMSDLGPVHAPVAKR